MTNSTQPTIEVTLITSGWRAHWTRYPQYEGFGQNPAQAIGHLVSMYPRLFGLQSVRYSRDAATQTFVLQNGLDSEV